MKRYFSILKIMAYICLAVFLNSCKKEIVYEGPMGELKGKVILVGLNTTLTDYRGVLITIDGSSPLLQSTTNQKGEYAIENLKTGIYDIVFTKDSFATFKMVSQQVIGGDVPIYLNPVALYKLPDVKINDLKVDTGRYSPYYPYVLVTGSLSVSTNVRLRYYVSDSSNVSYTNYLATEMVYSDNGASLSFYLSSTILSIFPNGKQLYVIVYPSVNSTNGYIDIITGNQIYSINTHQASAVVPFTRPITLSY